MNIKWHTIYSEQNLPEHNKHKYLKKMHLADHELMQIGRIRYSEKCCCFFLPYINFELAFIKQTTLIIQGSTHKNTF